jgi:cell division control protein 7
MLQPSKHALENVATTGSDRRVEQLSQEPDPKAEEHIEEVDEVVKEDMKKLEDTFPGISDRFRLVNRIGEGTISADLSSHTACPGHLDF